MPNLVCRKDNDGHQYMIPRNMVKRFDALFAHYCEQKYGTEEYWNAEDAFNDEFSNYMVG